jgi:hypothetical protein
MNCDIEAEGRRACPAGRTFDTGLADAAGAMEHLAGVGIDKDDAGRALEEQGVSSLHDSFAHAIGALDAKASQLRRG